MSCRNRVGNLTPASGRASQSLTSQLLQVGALRCRLDQVLIPEKNRLRLPHVRTNYPLNVLYIYLGIAHSKVGTIRPESRETP